MKQTNYDEYIEQYIDNVSLYLTATKKDDVLAELKGNLEGAFEMKQEALERELNEHEIEETFKAFGHPFKAASLYSEQQYLIGPANFPFFKKALVYSWIFIFSIHIISSIIFAMADPNVNFRLFGWLFNSLDSIIFVSLVCVVIFYLLEKNSYEIPLFKQFSLKTLAATKNTAIDRQDLITDIISETIALLWWIDVIKFPSKITFDNQAVMFSFGEVWQPLFWPIAFILGASIALHLWLLTCNYWSKLSVFIELILDMIAIAILIYLITASGYISVNIESDKILDFVTNINLGLFYTLIGILLVIIYETYKHLKIAYNVYRY